MKYITYENETQQSLPLNDKIYTIHLTHKKISKIINIDPLVNIQEIYLHNNRISRIEGLDNLPNLKKLFLYLNDIIKIDGLDNLVNLQILDLTSNKISKIEGLNKLINLQKLILSLNQIKKIEGLEYLKNIQIIDISGNIININQGLNYLILLQELDLSDNHLKRIEGLTDLISLRKLNLYDNQLNIINGLDTLSNLQKLNLAFNKISKIEGLNELANLEKLNMSFNQINKIEGLEKMINLKKLNLSQNRILRIEGLENLINLNKIILACNKISKLEGFKNLINVNYIDLCVNLITVIDDPSEITCCIKMMIILYDETVIIHPFIIRFLERNKLNSKKIQIFGDSQNIHDTTINRSIIESINRLLKDVPLQDVDQTELMNDSILTVKTKQLLLEYMSHNEQHSILLLSFAELFGVIWQIIKTHEHSSVIKSILNQEMSDSLCKCFTGRMNRLVNVLNGFDSRVIIHISDSDAIANIIIMHKKTYTDVNKLREVVSNDLKERGYSEIVIKDWIDFIE